MRVFLSRLLGFFLVLLLICGLLLALIPTLASTSWGRKQVVYWINRSIPGNIEIRTLELHWGKGQILEGVLLKDPEGQSVLGIEKFSTDATLWQLFRRSTHLGFTQVQDLNAAIVTDEKGSTNLQRALGIPPSNDIPPLSPSTIILSGVEANLSLFAHERPLSAQIKGLTRQENLNGSFEVNLSLNDLRASDWSELKQDAQHYLSIEGSKEAQVQVRVVNFPVDLIDRLIALKTPHLNGFFHSILGDRLNLTIDKENSNEGLVFNLTALSPLMQGDVKGKIVNGVLTLPESAIFHFNLTPEFVNPFTHQFELLNLSQLKIVFSALSLPLGFLDSETSVDPCLLEFKTDWTLSETEVDIYSVGNLKILSVEALLDSPICDKTVHLKIIGKGQQNKENFDIYFDSTLNKPKNFLHLLQQARQNLQGSIKISHLPLQLIPSLKTHPEWIEQIGSYADAQLIFKPEGKDEWEATLSLQTAGLILKEAQFRIGKEVALKFPAQVNWIGTTHCLSALLKTDELTLDQPCSLQFILKQFHLSLDNPKFAKYQLESFIPDLQFSHLWSWGTVHVQDLILKIEGQNLNQFNSQLTGQLALLNAEGFDSSLIKEPFKFIQTSNWKVASNGKIEMPNGQFQLNNSITNIQVVGRLTSNDELEFTQPIQMHYLLTPLAMQTLSQSLIKSWPKLQEETHLRLTIEPTSINLNNLTLSNLSLQGTLAIDQLILQDASRALPMLKDITLPWVADGPLNNFYANLKGLAYSQKNTIPSHLSAHFQFWPKPGYHDLAHTSAEIRMNFTGMPTSVFNMLLKTHDLSAILGPIIDLNFKTFYDPSEEQPGYWDLKLDSSQFHVEGRFKLNDAATLYDPSKPATIRLTLTPEGYQEFKNLFALHVDRKLASSVVLSGFLPQFYIPLKNPLLDQSRFDLQFSTTDIQWQDSTIPPMHLEGMINSQNILEDIHFNAQVISSSPSLTLQGTLTNVFDQQRKIHSWQDIGIKATLQGQQLTPALFQNLFFLNPEQTQKLKALFGDSFEVKANCQLQNLKGSLQASAEGTQGEIRLDGQIQQGILTLNQPLEGSVKMTPLLSQTFLAKNVPILSTAIGGENPIKFKIEPSQFSCPILPFKLDQVKIGKGILDLGKVHFRNDGELNSFLSLIHSISDPYLTIWFTPLYFQLDHGILTLKRLDMLIAHTYTLASWGNIDLNDHQADLVIGLSAQSLYYAFGIQGLDEQYILQVPLHSVNGKVEIDKKKATARISSLIAQSQGGSTGKLLGNLLDLALSNKGEIIPSPTTQPFPWKGEFDSTLPKVNKKAFEEPSSLDSSSTTQPQESAEGKKKKKHKHHKDAESNSETTLKGLQDGAVQILDQLFGK